MYSTSGSRNLTMLSRPQHPAKVNKKQNTPKQHPRNKEDYTKTQYPPDFKKFVPEKKSENLVDFRNKLSRNHSVGSWTGLLLDENTPSGGYQLRLNFDQSQSGNEVESAGFPGMKSGSVFGYFARFNGYFRCFFKGAIEKILPQSLGTIIIS